MQPGDDCGQAPQEALGVLAVDEPNAATSPVMQMLGTRTFRVTTDPSRAVELIRAERCDVVMINADLLGSDAFTLSRTLRAEGCLGVIALLTSQPNNESHLAALAAGATDYLDQSIPRETLVERLRAHVAGSRIKALGVLFPVVAEIPSNAGLLTMSLAPTLVALSGRPLALTRVEERLLARLWAGRGTIIPWSELAASTWMGRRVTPQALRVHLSQLRRKLRKLGLVIDHVRGAGDRLLFRFTANSEAAIEDVAPTSVKKN